MATLHPPKPSFSDCDLQKTNPNPKSDSSNALVPTIQSTTPAVCLIRFADDSTSGVSWAPYSTSTFAILSGVHSLVVCFLKRQRGKDDVINSGVGGCCTGLCLSFPGAPLVLLQSCLTFGAFSFIIEGLNK